jgi:hypothetical protein
VLDLEHPYDKAWSDMKADAVDHTIKAAGILEPTARLIEKATRRFCELPAPQTEKELIQRHRQETALRSLIAGLIFAQGMSVLDVRATQSILGEMTKLSESDFLSRESPTEIYQASAEFLLSVIAICKEHASKTTPVNEAPQAS